MSPRITLLTEENFNAIFDGVIEEVLATLGVKGNPFCEHLKKKKGLLLRYYNEIKSNIRFRYMQNPEGLIDRHKCAAAFMMAFLNKVDIKENQLNKERIAITLGLYILKIFINTKNVKYRNPGMVAFINKHGFKFPDCSGDDGVYKHNWALGIHYDHKESALSALSLANALFMVESYNRLLMEQSNKTK